MGPRGWTGAALVAALVLVVVVTSSLTLGWPPSPLGATGAAASSLPPATPTVYRNLTISFAPSVGGFSYAPTELEVPAHVAVVFTITNYDPSVATLPTPSDAQVRGTTNGAMVVTEGGVATTLTALPIDQIAHTFTISDSYYQANVPILAAENGPVQVSFTMVFDFPGAFAWGCVVLCDGGMPGTMYGSLTVVP